MTPTIYFNQRMDFTWISPLLDYERDITALSKLKFQFFYDDVTKQNSPLTYAEGRKEVLITVKNVTVEQASFIKQLIINLK